MRILARHKKAHFDYEIMDTIEVGIVLVWHEVKACKVGHPNISDAIVKITSKGPYITNMDLPLYVRTSPVLAHWYDPKWPRRLLMTKNQITKLHERTQKTWLRLIPLELYETATRFIKLKIGLWKLKKKVEKRSVIKDREVTREIDRAMKKYR